MSGNGAERAGRRVSGVREREPTGRDRARERDLGKAAGGRYLVAREEAAVPAVDRRPVAPGRPGEIQRAAAAVHHLAPMPGDAPAPVLEGSVEQPLQAQRRAVGALIGTDRHLPLHELLPRECERGILGAVALNPAGALEVRDDPGIAASLAQPEVERERVAAEPVEGVVAE